jgi:F-type H+-transporting ATPase subunit b
VEQEHAPADAHAAGEHASSGFPPFDQIDTFPSQVFWLVATFGLLYFCASLWLLPKVKKTIADRDSAIAKDVAEAAAASQKADAAAKALEARIAEARARSRDTAAKAKAEADAKVAAETAKVEADLAKRLSAAEARIGDLRKQAMSNVPAVAGEAVVAITEKLAGVKPSPDAVKRAIESVTSRA